MDAKLVMCKERKTDTDDERFTENSFEHTLSYKMNRGSWNAVEWQWQWQWIIVLMMMRHNNRRNVDEFIVTAFGRALDDNSNSMVQKRLHAIENSRLFSPIIFLKIDVKVCWSDLEFVGNDQYGTTIFEYLILEIGRKRFSITCLMNCFSSVRNDF